MNQNGKLFLFWLDLKSFNMREKQGQNLKSVNLRQKIVKGKMM